MNGYIIGFIVEAIIALLLLAAIIYVVTAKRKTYSVSDYEESDEAVEKEGAEPLMLSYDAPAGQRDGVPTPPPSSDKPPVLGIPAFSESESPIYRPASPPSPYDNHLPIFRRMPRPARPNQLELVSDEVVYEDGIISRPPMARNIRQVPAVYVADEDRAAYDDVFRNGRPYQERPAQPSPYAPPYQDYSTQQGPYAPPYQDYPTQQGPYMPPYQEHPMQQGPYMPPYQDYPTQQGPYMPPYQDYPAQQGPYMSPYQERSMQASAYARLYGEYPAQFVPYVSPYQSRQSRPMAGQVVEADIAPDVQPVYEEETVPSSEEQVSTEESASEAKTVGIEYEYTPEIGAIMDSQTVSVEESEDEETAESAGVEAEPEAAKFSETETEEAVQEEPEEVEAGASSEISAKLDEILSKLNVENEPEGEGDSEIGSKLDEILSRLAGEDKPDDGEDTNEIRDKLDTILSRMGDDKEDEEVTANDDTAEIRSKLDEILTRLDEVEARSAERMSATGEYYGKSSHRDNYPYLFGEGRTTEEYEGAPRDGTADVGEDGAVVRFTPSDQSFTESYEGLSKEQKKFFTDILNYAMNKPATEEKITKSAITVRSNGKQILRLKIRRRTTVASFKLENDLLREYRRNTSAPIKLKDTEVYVVDEDSKQTACGLIDLMIEQYEQRRQEDIERRKAIRAAKRAEQRAAAGEVAAGLWVEEDTEYDSDEFDDEYDELDATEYFADYDDDDDEDEEEFEDAEELESETSWPEEAEPADVEPVDGNKAEELSAVAPEEELEPEAAEVEPAEAEHKADKLADVESGFSEINARLDGLLAKFHLGKQTGKEPASEAESSESDDFEGVEYDDETLGDAEFESEEPKQQSVEPEEGKAEEESDEEDDGFYSPFIDDDND